MWPDQLSVGRGPFSELSGLGRMSSCAAALACFSSNKAGSSIIPWLLTKLGTVSWALIQKQGAPCHSGPRPSQPALPLFCQDSVSACLHLASQLQQSDTGSESTVSLAIWIKKYSTGCCQHVDDTWLQNNK